VSELLEDSGGFVVTGVMAAGKSTVADLLARRFARGVHLRGDVFRKMIVTGRDPISPRLGAEAIRQLDLRQRLAANAANEYWRDGFTVVLQDIYIGQSLSQGVDRLDISPLHVIVLAPSDDVIASREQHRGKTGYGDWTIEQHYSDFERETPHIGLWIDTSDLSPEETVDQILLRLSDSRVG
jgi:chloramphenicol 3-O-phosphotransferase